MASIDKRKSIRDTIARAKANEAAAQKNKEDAFIKKTKIESEAGATQQKAYGFVRDNILHKYASYNYIFTLSALGRDELNNPSLILSNSPHDIIARTGGIGPTQKFGTELQDDQLLKKTGDGSIAEEIARQDRQKKEFDKLGGKTGDFARRVLAKNRDIYFERVEIESVPFYNQERKLMNFQRVNFQLSEPLGISLWQKIRAAAANNGFKNHLQAPFLLTVEFKGYDTFGNEVPENTVKRFMPITLSTSSMQLNAGGATYDLNAVPWTEFGKSNAFLFTRGSGDVKGKGRNLNSYLQYFADSLNKNMQQEVDDGLREYADTYVITADSRIGNGETAQYDNFYDGIGDYGAPQSGQGKREPNFKTASYKSNQSIAKILEDLVRQFDQYNDISAIADKYWADIEAATAYDTNEKMPTPWVPWFKIQTTVTVHREFDKVLNSHRRTIHYHIEPFNIHVANLARAGLGGFQTWSEYTRKVYDYIYTGRNLDILDLNIDYNSSYALSTLVNAEEKQPGISTESQSIFYKLKRFLGSFSGKDTTAGTFPEPDLPVQAFPTTSKTESDAVLKLPNQTETQEFYDFITNPPGDMVKIDMRIMGDPAFIGQDIFLPMPTPQASGTYNKTQAVGAINGFEWDDQKGCFNFDRAETFVKLNFIFPNDFDENTGLHTFAQGDTPQFTGLYRVNRVVNVFENGQFTQNLDMSRYLNQNNPSNVVPQNKVSGVNSGQVENDNTGEINVGGESA